MSNVVNKLKQFFRRIFKTKDKYILERKLKMENELLISEDELLKKKELNQSEYIYLLNLNKINRLLIDQFILELNKKFYGK
jgi:hypothetical protein